MTTLPGSLQERFTARPPAEHDIPQIIELVMALDMMHYGVADEYAPDDIQDDWSHLNRLTDAWAITSSDGRLAAYATLTDRGYGHLVADGYVHPNFQGLGIGTALVRLMEARARELVDLAPAGSPGGAGKLSSAIRRHCTKHPGRRRLLARASLLANGY